MSDHSPINIMAFSPEDLAIVSGLAQDMIVQPDDMMFDQAAGVFLVRGARFCHEHKRRFWRPSGHRVDALLRFGTVSRVRFKGFEPGNGDTPLALLALRLDGADALEVTFSGGSAIRLSIEAVDVHLKDVGDAYPARKRPRHGDDF